MIARKKTFDFDVNFKEAMSFYRSFGFCVFRNIYKKNNFVPIFKKIEQITNSQLDNLIASKDFKKKQSIDKKIVYLQKKNDLFRKNLYDVMQGFPETANLGLNKKIYKVAKFLNIKVPILRTSQIRMDLPKDRRFLIPPHQEVKGIRSPNMIFFISAMRDINNNMGSLNLSPGSFLLNSLLPKTSDKNKYQFVDKKIYKKYPLIFFPLLAGETILLNMNTIHGSRSNISKKIRWSSIVRIEDAQSMPHLIKLDSSFIEKYDLKG